MSKQLTIKFQDGDHFLDLDDFADIIDIEKVHSYKLEASEKGDSFSIRFFDFDGNEIFSRHE